ncbi:hypothetical protein CL629_03440 [bacterium]|nr:hypothetical protein [bacterium]|tara:strand:- start:17343 stop:17693 length:351 start_codon:yes stop_codon:yes gene_type:complete
MSDMNSSGGILEVKYLKEFFMLAVLAGISWTLINTINTSEKLAVMSESFRNMKASFVKLEASVEKATEKRYDEDDAQSDFKIFTELLEEKTRERYHASDAQRDKNELLELIKNHTH